MNILNIAKCQDIKQTGAELAGPGLCPFARQVLLRNGGKLQSTCEQIWGRKLRRKHALVEHTPPREALLAYKAAPALLNGGGEQAGGSRVLKTTVPSVSQQ